MIDKYVLATNDDGDLAVRTVSATESSSVTDTTSVITATEDGKLAVRVVGGSGGGDSHNKGFFATQEALEEAYPMGQDGDYAIVGSTDTVWVWDSDTGESGAWIDTDTNGQVTSVNGQTGDVTVSEVPSQTGHSGEFLTTNGTTASWATVDALPSQTGYSGRVLGTDGFVAGWVKPEIVQVSALPAASEDEVDNIYQFVGTTDANYTNGYFYKCVSDGQDPATYSWTQTDVQPQGDSLPDQTGQNGKFLTTDGTDASWSNKPLVNKNSNWSGLSIIGESTTSQGSISIGYGAKAASGDSIAIGYATQVYTTNSQASVVIGSGASASQKPYQVSIGCGSEGYGSSSVALGYKARANADNCIQIGFGTNSTANTFSIGLSNSNNYRLLDSDGTIPEARLADTTNAQQGDVLTLDSNGNAVWQAGGGGGGSTALSLTLAAANWSNNSITVTATGVTASNNVIVSPAPASQSAYTTAGVMCTAQASDSLTFTCTATPSSDLTVTVLII